ncbi:hypothetical protein AGABI2DRAFT_182424 [Agaricus bisporus var. bisporus H97]|uniref:hypothetical protein n=1 Tax=Agaricus bisporus var. bisporus (strain H97 / ATCC MYA-4626 / FGSC 10389) TaxID=936046 RepID=UPI00029F73C1|nr:hypothetical protein AGABI2DRAFT_182424 [Agaricus bisporus var. bisporus H97]EKV51459.1 hypothetical protein AGABI2DRAFT_182424 [Agaricus bisporus var. bisporus H97]
MAKKKKTQLKPVNRGFATVSVPKKIAPVEDIEDKLIEDTSGSSLPGRSVGDELESTKDAQAQPTGDSDLMKLEEQLLQSLVDRHQDKTEKEITRYSIETDRNLSKNLNRVELHPQLRDEILGLVKDSLQEHKVLEEAEDKALARLGITYGVLRRLGFSEERVEESLRAISGLDLEEALDWLYTICAEEEYLNNKGIEISESRTPRKSLRQSSRLLETSRTPAQFLASDSPSPKLKKAPRTTSKLDAAAPIFHPAQSLSAEAQSLLDLNISTAAIQSSENPDQSFEEDDPTLRYVQLVLKQEHMLNNRKNFTAIQIKEIRSLLAELEKDFLFDEKKAAMLVQKERGEVLSKKLRGSEEACSSPAKTPGTEALSKPSDNAQVPPPSSLLPSSSSSDVFDDTNSDASGGLLDLLEEPSAVTADGTIITLKDMSLPRHWSGKRPKDLLREAVAGRDRFAVVTYTLISGHSRAKRVSLSIHWDGTRFDHWSMDDVACIDQTQAEQYIALTALHALTFPQSQGFTSHSGGASKLTFFRLLPPSARDLWDELENARKLREDSTNRQVWAKLRSIIQPKLDPSSKITGKASKAIHDKKSHVPATPHSKNVEADFEQLITAYRTLRQSSNYNDMLMQRESLPIAKYRNNIIEILEHNQVLVLSGETGCGKSTQVPSFILEDQLLKGKPCKIYCTEPRRISAISLAQRVSRELGEPPNAVGTLNSLIGYAIRLESNITRNTRLAYVTNGIALRMLESGTGQGDGTAVDELTHIIIDEVHERTIESDFLLIVLKSLLVQRPDLRVILMSATVDAEKISAYFGHCPTLHVPGRTFPVDVFYLEDAVEYTQWSITENSPYARRLHDKFYRGKKHSDWTEETAQADDDDDDEEGAKDIKFEKRYSQETTTTLNLFDERFIPYELIIRLLEKICFEDVKYNAYSSAILIFVPGIGEIRRINDALNGHPRFGSDEEFKIYPLHSTLSSENQNSVFEVPLAGIRKIVIATNIAETGITIPDITCVIDTGKHREMRFDEKRQISRLVETFVAKSNASQRRGRAGRVQQGLCFHLFTKIRHDSQMADNPQPEMMRLSLSDLALRIKIMGINLGSSIENVLSQALDPPISVNVQRAIAVLIEVHALTPAEEITPMGRLLSKLPTDVHIGKFLLIATLFRCLDPALTIAAALNSKSPFLSPFGLEAEAERAKASFKIGDSDFLTLHNAFDKWRKASANGAFVYKFCRVNYISHQTMQQIEELRQQFLAYLIDSAFIQVHRSLIRDLNRARWNRMKSKPVALPTELDFNSSNPSIINAALVAGLYPKVLSLNTSKSELKMITNNQVVSIHHSSVNFHKKLSDIGCNYFAYFTLMHSKKLYAWENGPADELAILLLCGDTEFRPVAETATVDRNKLKFHISPKSNVALKYLRKTLDSILAQQFTSRPLNDNQIRWNELGMEVLGKLKPKEDDATLIDLRLP